MKTITAIVLMVITFMSCSSDGDSVPTPDYGNYKYEVTSNRSWSGSYIREDGAEIFVWNQPTNWEYTGTVKERPFLAYVRMTQDSPHTVPTYITCTIYHNGTIVKQETDTFTNVTDGRVTMVSIY